MSRSATQPRPASAQSAASSNTGLAPSPAETNLYVYGFAAAVGVVLISMALFTQPMTDIDELGLFNPVYTFLTTGRMTYPVHFSFETMAVHPPVHYLQIGALMKAGFSLGIAESLPSVVLVLGFCYLACDSTLPKAVRIGLLFGVFAALTAKLPLGTVTAPASTAFYSIQYGLRPDLNVALSWISGLVALESARRREWSMPHLVVGTFLLTYAAGLHYFAAASLASIGVYMLALIRDVRVAAWPRILAMAVAGSAFGIPYLALFVVPHWADIRLVADAVQGSGSPLDALARHVREYDRVADYIRSRWQELPLHATLLAPVLQLKVPLALLGATLLAWFARLRLFALAALPLPLFVLLFSQGKSSGYYLPEMILYLTAVGALLAAAVQGMLQRVLPVRRQGFGAALSTFLLGLLLVRSTPLMSDLVFNPVAPDIHPMEVARAASKQIVGSEARLGGRIGVWYVSGADEWRNIESDLLWRSDLVAGLDAASYFSLFDAIVEDNHMSEVTLNSESQSVSTWYLEGLLKLRGFYFAGHQRQPMSTLTFDVSAEQPVLGFAQSGNDLVRFDARTGGQMTFATLACPSGYDTESVPPHWFVNALALPTRAAPSPALLVAVMAPSAELATWGAGCQPHDTIAGEVTPIDARLLVSTSRAQDAAMQFRESITELFLTTTVQVNPVSEERAQLLVHVSSSREALAGIEVSINSAADGTATGDWRLVAAQTVSGSAAAVALDADISGLGKGTHILAINVTLADGRKVWWYEQPRQILRIPLSTSTSALGS